MSQYVVNVGKLDDKGNCVAVEEYIYDGKPLLIAVENPDPKVVEDIKSDYDYWRYMFSCAEYNIMTAEESH